MSGRDIRFGLLAVKNLGRGFLQHIIRDRELNGPFSSFFDFCKREFGELNRRSLESLIKCGALDGLDLNRRQMLESSGAVLDFLEEDKRRNVEGQLGFFDLGGQAEEEQSFVVPPKHDFSEREKLAYEKEVTGMFLSGHPMAAFLDRYGKYGAVRIGDLLDEENEAYSDGQVVTVLGIVSSMRMKVTKSGSTMAFLMFEDMFGSMEALVFPNVLSQFGAYLTEGQPVMMQARLSRREDEDAKLICESLQPLREDGREEELQPVRKSSAKRPGLYLKVPSGDSPRCQRACQLLELFEGTTPVYFFYNDVHKLFSAPISLRVSLNDVLLEQLGTVLGNKNVAIVER